MVGGSGGHAYWNKEIQNWDGGTGGGGGSSSFNGDTSMNSDNDNSCVDKKFNSNKGIAKCGENRDHGFARVCWGKYKGYCQGKNKSHNNLCSITMLGQKKVDIYYVSSNYTAETIKKQYNYGETVQCTNTNFGKDIHPNFVKYL